MSDTRQMDAVTTNAIGWGPLGGSSQFTTPNVTHTASMPTPGSKANHDISTKGDNRDLTASAN